MSSQHFLTTADHGYGFDVFGTVDTKIGDDAVIASGEEPVSDVEHMCKAVIDNGGNVFDILPGWKPPR